MTDSNKDLPQRPQDQQGLPSDLGNEMSSRAGYYDESPSGEGETPVGQPSTDTTNPGGVPTVTGDDRGMHQTGTSFGPTPEDDKLL
ncbi:hypothetical protein WDJ50_02990 [Deinococcus sp. VB142]|uniref:M-like protein n=1 Tax=Deinococcus sp. VB142 TaxID=3112952 RepID=A0AAU6Q4C1_9DEIO